MDDIQELMEAANCFLDCISEISLAQALKIVMLANAWQAADPGADITPAGLAEQAKCLMCYGIAEGDAIEILLLSKLFADDNG
ncbi:MAG TPA: hypothetical protein PKJ00_03460 [Verrucomicrobiota bacterium]|nr:hypothetical protein [Verrucomicrobiota bacterium]HNS68996.1 hypothetical protein [Verrucomicrobiota bacterium]